MNPPRISQDLMPPKSPPPALSDGAAHGNPSGKWTVLVAEDDDDVRLMMRTLLEMKGYASSKRATANRRSRCRGRAPRPDSH